MSSPHWVKVSGGGVPASVFRPLVGHSLRRLPNVVCPLRSSQSGKEASVVVERLGGNMMSLHAEPAPDRDSGTMGEGVGEYSELAFQTETMKADGDAQPLLVQYFKSIVRAAANPEELHDCIVCLGPMEVPRSLLQALAAPLHDVTGREVKRVSSPACKPSLQTGCAGFMYCPPPTTLPREPRSYDGATPMASPHSLHQGHPPPS
ncbi:unnamed protein product [Choristocarpus tenellus]